MGTGLGGLSAKRSRSDCSLIFCVSRASIRLTQLDTEEDNWRSVTRNQRLRGRHANAGRGRRHRHCVPPGCWHRHRRASMSTVPPAGEDSARTAQRSRGHLDGQPRRWAGWLEPIGAAALGAGGAYAAIAANGENGELDLLWALLASVIAGSVGFLGARQIRQIITRLDRAPSRQAAAPRWEQLASNRRPAAGAPPLPVSTGLGFVGREIELEQLRWMLDEVRAGHGRLILVAGSLVSARPDSPVSWLARRG